MGLTTSPKRETSSKMTIKMETAMMMMIVTMVLMTSTTKTWARECRSVCLADELAALKETLKEMQHSIYANQFFIKRNWKEVSGAPPDFFLPKRNAKELLSVRGGNEDVAWSAAVLHGKEGASHRHRILGGKHLHQESTHGTQQQQSLVDRWIQRRRAWSVEMEDPSGKR